MRSKPRSQASKPIPPALPHGLKVECCELIAESWLAVIIAARVIAASATLRCRLSLLSADLLKRVAAGRNRESEVRDQKKGGPGGEGAGLRSVARAARPRVNEGTQEN